MRRALAGLAATFLASGGPALALYVAAEWRLLRAGSIFGALVVGGTAAIPLAAAVYLAVRYTFMAPGNTK